MALPDILFAMLLSTPTAQAPADRPETEEARVERLHQIAEDAALVAFEVDPRHQVESALLLLAVAQHESGFAIDVDQGPCRAKRCGPAACLLQIEGNREERKHLFADRRHCFTVGLRALLKGAIDACPGETMRFAAYAGGNCERGQKGSQELFAYWQSWKLRYAYESPKIQDALDALEAEALVAQRWASLGQWCEESIQFL